MNSGDGVDADPGDLAALSSWMHQATVDMGRLTAELDDLARQAEVAIGTGPAQAAFGPGFSARARDVLAAANRVQTATGHHARQIGRAGESLSETDAAATQEFSAGPQHAR